MPGITSDFNWETITCTWGATCRQDTHGFRHLVGLANLFPSVCAPGITITIRNGHLETCNRLFLSVLSAISLMISMIFSSFDSSITIHRVRIYTCMYPVYLHKCTRWIKVFNYSFCCFIMMLRGKLWILMHAVIWILSSLVMMITSCFAINFCLCIISVSDFILEASLSKAQNTEWKVVPWHRSDIQGMCTHSLSNYVL